MRELIKRINPQSKCSKGYRTWSVCMRACVCVYTCVCVCVCVFVKGGREGRRFASVCMHTVGECFQSLRGIFHGHTRWAFEYPAQLKTPPMATSL